MSVTLPKSIVENAYEPFPAGTYMGVYADCGIAKNQDGSWMALELTFVDNEPIGDSPPDGRPFKDTITIRVKDQSILDFDDFSALPKELFGLRLGAGLLAGLALAFGEATEDEDGNVEVDLDSFIDNLQNGSLQGRTAAFVTKQRTRKYEDKDTGEEKTTVDTNAQRYFPVA